MFGSCLATGKIMCTISFDAWVQMNAGLRYLSKIRLNVVIFINIIFSGSISQLAIAQVKIYIMTKYGKSYCNKNVYNDVIVILSLVVFVNSTSHVLQLPLYKEKKRTKYGYSDQGPNGRGQGDRSPRALKFLPWSPEPYSFAAWSPGIYYCSASSPQNLCYGGRR